MRVQKSMYRILGENCFDAIHEEIFEFLRDAEGNVDHDLFGQVLRNVIKDLNSKV